MGLRLTAASLYLPGFVRKHRLELLFQATAASFGAAAPETGGLSFIDLLSLYARFTRAQSDRADHGGQTAPVKSALYENASRIGRQFRAEFGLKTAADVMQMSCLIYKLLNIDFKGEAGGKIVISRCFFSRFYSADTCRLISSLDEGLLAGLSAGGHLCFSQRLTAGSDFCLAHLAMPGGLS